MLYILGLYAAYVALFFAFIGLQRAFAAVRAKWLDRRIYAGLHPADAEIAPADAGHDESRKAAPCCTGDEPDEEAAPGGESDADIS